jgi:hypothetical protein
MDRSGIIDGQAAVCTKSVQLRAEAARLRGEVQGSLDDVQVTIQAVLATAETVQARLKHAQMCGASRSPCFRNSLVDRLQPRLASQPVIEQAKAMLMVRQGCDADQAFDILRRASQRTNTPVREVAQKLVASGLTRPTTRTPLTPLQAEGHGLLANDTNGRA